MKILAMNRIIAYLAAIILLTSSACSGQSDQNVIRKYLRNLAEMNPRQDNSMRRLRMTALYINMDKYGNITGKIKVTGDYTRGLENGQSSWNNVYIYTSTGAGENFDDGKRQDYMEGFKYVPSGDMLKASAFPTFPNNVESVFSRNLVWDMMAVEDFAWDYLDHLQLNENYIIEKSPGLSFEMADIGNYSHTDIQIEWSGISEIDNELCANIEYRSLNNKVDINMEQVKTKGTEQYWGNTRISLRTGQVLFGEMYSGTLQEAEVPGFKDKFVIKTVREIKVEKIK
jgi:hypothetical protein